MKIFDTGKTSYLVFLNTAYQLIGKLVTLLVTVGVTALITRLYGREAFGEFNLMQTWPALVYIIVDFGLNAIAVKEVSQDKSKGSQYFSAVLIIRFVFSIIIISILAVLIKVFPYSQALKMGIYINLFLVLSQSLFTTSNIIFQANLKYDQSVLCNLLGYCFVIVATIYLGLNHKPVMWIGFSYVIGGVISFITSLYVFRGFGVKFVRTWDWKILKPLIYASIPLGIMFVFSQISFKADSILLSVLSVPKSLGLNNSETVAIYGLPYKVFEVGLVLPTFLMNSLFPIFVKKHAADKNEFKKVFFKSIFYLGVLGVITSIFGVILSPIAVGILGGSEFSTSVFILQILLGGLTLYFLTQPISWLIVVLNKQKYLPGIYLFAAAFNVSANWYFIPRYSFYASSIITHISELLILILLIIFAIKSWKETYA